MHPIGRKTVETSVKHLGFQHISQALVRFVFLFGNEQMALFHSWSCGIAGDIIVPTYLSSVTKNYSTTVCHDTDH